MKVKTKVMSIQWYLITEVNGKLCIDGAFSNFDEADKSGLSLFGFTEKHHRKYIIVAEYTHDINMVKEKYKEIFK
jgi:hypothetical protein